MPRHGDLGIARLKELPNGIKKVSTKDGFKPGDLVRILDVPDSEYQGVGLNSSMKEMIGKVCEVNMKHSDGYYSVFTPDRLDSWNFPPSALEKVDEEHVHLTKDNLLTATGALNESPQFVDSIMRDIKVLSKHLEVISTNKQTKPKTMLKTISDRLARALNADKKAMYELSWIDENLEPTSLAIEQLHDILFDLHEKELGERAKAEVKRIKEEAKKK